MIYSELSLAFVLALVLIQIILYEAKKFHLVDIPNERSVHKIPTPTAGGIGIILSALIILTIFHFEMISAYWYVIISIVIVFIVGFIDDTNNIPPLYKFLGIAFAITLLCYNEYYIASLGRYFSKEIHLHWFLVFPITYFSVIGFTNALNLVDGIDGLAASISIVIFATLLAIGIKYEDTLIITLSSILFFSILAFLLFNWYPAKIFMGDSGSLTLGFIIAILCIKSLEYISPTSVLFITAIPIIDTILVMYRRIQRHGSPFKADKIHLHHLILFQKKDVRFTVVVLTLIQVVFSMMGYSAINNDDMFNLIQFVIIFYIFFSLFDQRLQRR